MSDDWKGGKNPLSFFVQVGGGLAAALVSSIVINSVPTSYSTLRVGAPWYAFLGLFILLGVVLGLAHIYYLGDAYASGLIMFGMFFYELDSIVTGLIASILLIMIYLYRMGHS
jgi:hypothetical protein